MSKAAATCVLSGHIFNLDTIHTNTRGHDKHLLEQFYTQFTSKIKHISVGLFLSDIMKLKISAFI
jgi:hypothetical protein